MFTVYQLGAPQPPAPTFDLTHLVYICRCSNGYTLFQGTTILITNSTIVR